MFKDAPTHKVKRIEVLEARRLSYQRCSRRAEHWFIVTGVAEVIIEGAPHCLCAGQAIDIPTGAAHRIANPGQADLVFVEVQWGDYSGEDDIERLDGDFGRAG